MLGEDDKYVHRFSWQLKRKSTGSTYSCNWENIIDVLLKVLCMNG